MAKKKLKEFRVVQSEKVMKEYLEKTKKAEGGLASYDTYLPRIDDVDY